MLPAHEGAALSQWPPEPAAAGSCSVVPGLLRLSLSGGCSFLVWGFWWVLVVGMLLGVSAEKTQIVWGDSVVLKTALWLICFHNATDK